MHIVQEAGPHEWCHRRMLGRRPGPVELSARLPPPYHHVLLESPAGGWFRHACCPHGGGASGARCRPWTSTLMSSTRRPLLMSIASVSQVATTVLAPRVIPLILTVTDGYRILSTSTSSSTRTGRILRILL